MINVIPVEVMDGWNVLEQCLSHDELIAERHTCKDTHLNVEM